MNANGNSAVKTVFAITEKDGKSYWSKIGVAFTNRDSSITVALDALPISGRLQIRTDDQRSERGREDRREVR